jgi:hypothetical protein
VSALKAEQCVDAIRKYIHRNPTAERTKIVRFFGKKWQKGRRTIDRYYQIAKNGAKKQILETEKIRESVIKKTTQEAYNDVLARADALKILTEIAKGNARQIGNELLVTTDSERIRAISTLAKCLGWEFKDEVLKQYI